MIWKCRDKSIVFDGKTKIMGIVNLTPDSFSDGGSFDNAEEAVDYALQLLADGADIIDLGAQSTRPGYTEICPEEEWKRLQPVLFLLRQKTDAPISVDTYFPFVAEKAAAEGADIINDVSGNLSGEMAEIIKKNRLGWVIMHSTAGGVKEVGNFFSEAITEATARGVQNEQLCLDMGIGFGKSTAQNLALLANTEAYKLQGIPLLLGTSRKRVIGAGSGEEDPQKRIYGNIAADTAAIFGGADIIRLHDVRNEIKGIRMADALNAAREKNNGQDNC